jgi:histidinol dehydrogenase
LTKAITTAGAIMIGNHTPTALGDFTAGPSHVLPTGRAGRFFSGLRVADFIRRTSLIRYDRASVKKGDAVVRRICHDGTARCARPLGPHPHALSRRHDRTRSRSPCRTLRGCTPTRPASSRRKKAG